MLFIQNLFNMSQWAAWHCNIKLAPKWWRLSPTLPTACFSLIKSSWVMAFMSQLKKATEASIFSNVTYRSFPKRLQCSVFVSQVALINFTASKHLEPWRYTPKRVRFLSACPPERHSSPMQMRGENSQFPDQKKKMAAKFQFLWSKGANILRRSLVPSFSLLVIRV